ncbi:MAG: DUF4838 domain-containing protein [Planctomycetota bacterium]|nr:DUF4838 domain-containing protein [Planctomycetota bacterium]
MKKIVAAVALLCLASSCTSTSRQVDKKKSFPVVDGSRQAIIVGVDIIPRLKQLGYYRGPPHFLQHYIQKSTGRKLNVVRGKDYKPLEMPYPIFVGNSAKGRELFGDKLKEMDADSYIVHVTPDYAILIGASKHSSAWAQFDFARTYFGIDTYLPNKLGTVVPRHESVLVPTETRIEIPAFRSRAFSALNTNNGLRSQPDIPWRMYRRYEFSHNIHRFITVKEYGKTHPEYFPERGGKRLIVSSSSSPGPCIGNPDVVKIISEKVGKFFDENPDRLTVSLGMTDGGWCECALCKANDGPSLEISGDSSPKSQRYYTFLNQVARDLQISHPGKSIGVLGYAGAEYPPANLKVERNIIPYMCYTRANWFDGDVKRRDLKSTDAWADRVDQVGVYEYLYGSGFSIPRIYNRYLADFLQHVARKGGGGFYAEIYSNHGLDGHKAWVTEKLLWNPFQDVDVLQDQWCDALFEDAAAPMKRYFERLAKTRIRNGKRRTKDPHGKFHFFRKDRQLELFLPKNLDPLWDDLAAAGKLAHSKIVKDRIDYFASTFKITDSIVRQYHAYKKANELFNNHASSAELLAALIDGDRSAPQDDTKAYIAELQKGDPTKFLGGVEVSLSTELGRSVVVDLAGNETYRLLKRGERSADKLIKAAQDKILAAAPSGAMDDEIARRRMDALSAAAGRIAVAHRVKTKPTIDGKPDEGDWKWNEHHPWFAWKSGVPSDTRTSFAFLYDDDFLYVALRCPQNDLSKMKRCEGYGASAWKYASVEMHINPDERDADKELVKMFQTIPAYGGGLWERDQRATEKYAITDNGKDLYQIEFALSFKKLRMNPKEFPYLRVNFIRNIKGGGHSGLGWFPSSGAHASYAARGWLIFH